MAAAKAAAERSKRFQEERAAQIKSDNDNQSWMGKIAASQAKSGSKPSFGSFLSGAFDK